MIAPKPAVLTDVEAASVPVAACTAYQMLSHHASVSAGQTVLVLGGTGNVGAYAVQLAQLGGARVVATAREHQIDFLRTLGDVEAIPAGAPPARLAAKIDAVIDTVGGAALAQAFDWLRPGGVLISAVAAPDQDVAMRHGARAQFILVNVTTADLRHLAGLFEHNSCGRGSARCCVCPRPGLRIGCSKTAGIGQEKSCLSHNAGNIGASHPKGDPSASPVGFRGVACDEWMTSLIPARNW